MPIKLCEAEQECNTFIENLLICYFTEHIAFGSSPKTINVITLRLIATQASSNVTDATNVYFIKLIVLA